MGPKQLDRAIWVATEAHKGQYDKAGEPYILHPIRVMLSLTTYEERIVGILHDVVEDTDLTLASPEFQWFSTDILRALDGLTHRPDEDYEAYIERIRRGPSLARRVKLADLKDNLNKNRIPFPSERDLRRWNKYEAAYARLTEDD